MPYYTPLILDTFNTKYIQQISQFKTVFSIMHLSTQIFKLEKLLSYIHTMLNTTIEMDHAFLRASMRMFNVTSSISTFEITHYSD